jgi:hypothetical protein
VDALLFGRARIYGYGFNCESGQPKCNPAREERARFEWQAYSTQNIRYFFVADRIEAGEMSVQYCPTGEMVADFFTKPLQGIQFQKFRNLIMNIDPSTNSSKDQRSVLQNDDGATQIVGSADVKAKDGREPFKVTGPSYWKDRMENKLASKK